MDASGDSDLGSDNVAVPRQMVYDRGDPIQSLSDKAFYRSYGFLKEDFLNIFEQFKDGLQSQRINLSTALLPIQRLALFIAYLRSDIFFRSIAEQFFVRSSVSTAHRVVFQVARVIHSARAEYFTLPGKDFNLKIEINCKHHESFCFADLNEQEAICREFFRISGIPSVVGAVDGTHIFIRRPTLEETERMIGGPIAQDLGYDDQHNIPAHARVFFDRLRRYSINCMIMVDAKKRVRYYSSRHPGKKCSLSLPLMYFCVMLSIFTFFKDLLMINVFSMKVV